MGQIVGLKDHQSKQVSRAKGEQETPVDDEEEDLFIEEKNGASFEKGSLGSNLEEDKNYYT